MLNDVQTTTVSKSMTSQSVISSTDSSGNTTNTPVANMSATFNSQGASLNIQVSGANFAELSDTANNASTQSDVLNFIKQVLTACGDAGMTYYGAASSSTSSTN